MRLFVVAMALSLIGCSSAYTVSAGTYVLELRDPEGRVHSTEVEVQVPTEDSLRLVLPDGEKMEGTVRGNQIEFKDVPGKKYTTKMSGSITSHDSVAGTVIKVGLEKNETAEWKMTKKTTKE